MGVIVAIRFVSIDGEPPVLQCRWADSGQSSGFRSRALAAKSKKMSGHPYRIGAAYLIRTVTNYYTGRLLSVGPQELLLCEAAWIADTGRFAQAVASGILQEVEPYPPGSQLIVGRGSIIDAVEITWDLPKVQK